MIENFFQQNIYFEPVSYKSTNNLSLELTLPYSRILLRNAIDDSNSHLHSQVFSLLLSLLMNLRPHLMLISSCFSIRVLAIILKYLYSHKSYRFDLIFWYLDCWEHFTFFKTRIRVYDFLIWNILYVRLLMDVDCWIIASIW